LDLLNYSKSQDGEFDSIRAYKETPINWTNQSYHSIWISWNISKPSRNPMEIYTDTELRDWDNNTLGIGILDDFMYLANNKTQTAALNIIYYNFTVCGYPWSWGDFGDAPDSSNHYPLAEMTAYPYATAHYPTVFDPATGLPQGPCHSANTSSLAKETALWTYLGNNVSLENDADLLPDQDDNITNLNVTADKANLDWFDDGLYLPLNFSDCAEANITFNVTLTHTFPQDVNYSFNAWFDWNRDGDWEDSFTCATSGDAPEWAVQNMTLSFLADYGSYPQTFTYTTPMFMPINTNYGGLWMRITLDPDGNMNPDGSGPFYCYSDGETEDYYLNVNPRINASINIRTEKDSYYIGEWVYLTDPPMSRLQCKSEVASG
jgi:hypothetical protein